MAHTHYVPVILVMVKPAVLVLHLMHQARQCDSTYKAIQPHKIPCRFILTVYCKSNGQVITTVNNLNMSCQQANIYLVGHMRKMIRTAVRNLVILRSLIIFYYLL